MCIWRSWCKRWRFYYRRSWCRRWISSSWYRRRPELEAGGATKLIGAGGYSGGAGIAVNGEQTISGGKNGLAGNHINNSDGYEYYYSGGGYFSGPDGSDSKNKNRAELCLGGFNSVGQDLSTYSATGGTGGNGGSVDIEDYSNLEAYNGNKITDNSSNVPLEINSQSGLKLPKYSYKKVEGRTFLLNRVSKKRKVKTTKYGQGIGAGAGYYEGTNGIYRNKTSED